MTYDSISKVVADIGKQQENIILGQLNDLIKRGLLVIESTQPTLVQDPDSTKILLRQSVKLTLKDIEYIQSLEEENKKLKEKLLSIETALKD